MTDNVELPLPQNSYAEQVVLAGCMRDEKVLFDTRAQRLLRIMQALPTKLRVSDDEGRVVLSTGTMPFAALVAGEHDTPGDAVRDFVSEYALTLRAFAADCAYRFQQRQAWTRWADTLQEVLHREYN